MKIPTQPPAIPLERTISIEADVLVRVQAIIDPASVGNEPVIDVRVCRRSPDGSGETFSPTHEGLRVPLHLSGLIADAIRNVGARAVERVAIASSTRS
jgi:hypothetical protein